MYISHTHYNFIYHAQHKAHALLRFIIQIPCTVRIPVFRLVDLYHVALGYDETTSLTSLSWCNTRGVNSIRHCHTPWLRLTQSLTISVCSVFNLNVNTLIARELSGFNCTRSLTMNEKFSIPHSAASCGIENCSFIVSEPVQVNPDNSLAECVNL